jgi:hypothetical protein
LFFSTNEFPVNPGSQTMFFWTPDFFLGINRKICFLIEKIFGYADFCCPGAAPLVLDLGINKYLMSFFNFKLLYRYY